jgi:hypothetical protein
MSVMAIYRPLAHVQGPFEHLEQQESRLLKSGFLFRVLSKHHGVTVKTVELPTFPSGV